MAKAHPGFKAVQSGIASQQGVSQQEAGAMSSTRKAPKSAKKKNINKMKMPAMKGMGCC